jgi:(R,R)-butanediol dehydrogenase / meso-butanediol dehydrogenase / diacetyl reductase
MTSATMRAAVYHGARDVRIESRPVPRPRAGEVLVEVLRAGICGTDATEYLHGPRMIPLHQANPNSGHEGPLVLGHEFFGRVVEAGAGAESLLGRRVATGAGVSCGACRWCAARRTNLCARYFTLGLNSDGGLAEFAVVPAPTCVPVPDPCSDDAAGLAQPLAVGLHAARRAGVLESDTVVLCGAGAIGRFILCALDGQAKRIVALDIADEARRAALALGADEAYDVRDADPVRLVRELTAGEGAEVVIEATGAPGAARRALQMAARGGRVLLVGLPHEPQTLDLAEATLREVDVRTTVAHVCDEDIPQALELLARGTLADLLVDRVIALEDLVPEGLEALAGGRARGKILVDPRPGRSGG